MNEQIQQLIQYAIPALSGIAGAMGGAYWFRRWVDKTDGKLEYLSKGLHKIEISLAVTQSEKQATQGQFKQLQIALDNCNAELGKMNGSMDALWRVLKSNENMLIPSRLSDKSRER